MPDIGEPRGLPRVTVAMVTYNSERYVAEAIDSVLSQEYQDFELLICDDCSTDRTWQIINEFSDRRIRAIRNDSNIGEYPNRNQALHLARGGYIIFIDGDDYIYPHGLGFMVKMIEQFPRAAFVSAQASSEKFIYPVELTPREFCSCLFFGPLIVGSNFTQLLFRTESLRAARGFDLRYRTGDTYIQFALGMRENCVLINGGVAWWRRHAGQASDVWLGKGRGVAEIARYGREVLEHPDCPLSAAEKGLAQVFICRPVLRRVVRHLLQGHLNDALQLLRFSGLSPADWKYLFAKWHRPYLSDVGGANPIRRSIAASALTSPVARYAVHGMNGFRYSIRASKIVDRLTARRDQLPVIQNDVTANRELRV